MAAVTEMSTSETPPIKKTIVVLCGPETEDVAILLVSSEILKETIAAKSVDEREKAFATATMINGEEWLTGKASVRQGTPHFKEVQFRENVKVLQRWQLDTYDTIHLPEGHEFFRLNAR